MRRNIKGQEVSPQVSTLGYYTFFRFSLAERKSRIRVDLYKNGMWRTVSLEPHNFIEKILTPTSVTSPFTGDAETWGTIQGWLIRCLEEHTLCNRRDTAYIPSRLVKLCTTAEPTFCIVDRDKVQLNSQYLALSYCWGTDVGKLPPKLTRPTLERFSKEQPCYVLPKTFRDAIEVARRLGICYLWIDSLCILQDSEEDWIRESTSMRDVYSNAFLTIAALGAKHSDGGLFFSRDPTKLNPTILYLVINDAGITRPFVFYGERYTWNNSFREQPLLKRGWVVQERVLSERVLYFGSEQLFWECYEVNCCETHRETLESPTLPSRIEVGHVWKGLTGHFRHSVGPKNDTQQLFKDWDQLLEVYTVCKLTCPKDKLVAVSGIVEDMRRHLTRLGCESTKYLAGIWQQELPKALLWEMAGVDSCRHELYHAPSWSWASIDGGIILSRGSLFPDADILASVLDAWVTPVNRGDETGEVSDGMITLAGIFIIANLCPLSEFDAAITERGVTNFRNHKDDTLLCKTKATGGTYSAVVTFDTQGDDLNQVLCLPIMRRDSNFKGKNGWIVEGLVTTRVGDKNYQRVGIFYVAAETEDDYRLLFADSNRGYVDII
ncbi:HET-domain-containing protein [Annulohypoxylon stygium]|nr:HET-domain-containing protein [Annulohypoxylon stygium]